MEVIINLESSIVDKLMAYGKPRGFSLEETIKFIVGEEINYQTDLIDKMLPLAGELRPIPNFTPLINKLPSLNEITSFNINEIIQQAAQIVTAANEPKCKGCTQLLTSKDLIEGFCAKCGERI